MVSRRTQRAWLSMPLEARTGRSSAKVAGSGRNPARRYAKRKNWSARSARSAAAAAEITPWTTGAESVGQSRRTEFSIRVVHLRRRIMWRIVSCSGSSSRGARAGAGSPASVAAGASSGVSAGDAAGRAASAAGA
uniref:Uncharacterized protein n=1 Tax=Triticum urartu TaxID=4572 RepID=A0A8R7UQ34_TRIUA